MYTLKKFVPHLSYFLFWILFFVAVRGLFLLYHINLTSELPRGVVPKIFWYGLRMDASFAAYICIFPFLLYCAKLLVPAFRVHKIMHVYSIILIVVLSFMTVADLELYTAWGYRMDSTPLIYLKSPKEAAGIASSAPVLGLMLIMVILCFIFIYLLRFFNRRMVFNSRRTNIFHFLPGLFLVAILFVPIRGGFQRIPLNISDVYFSEHLFADHAAINLPWNFMFSVLNQHKENNPYHYFPEKEAEDLVQQLYTNKGDSVAGILSTDRPNIVFVILESFTAKVIGSLGGIKGVTPRLDAIAAEGLSFHNFYASGDRSEKGQVAILSGYPNQAVNSIAKTPNKTRRLPSLVKTLESYGYSGSYYYGGELEFGNIKSYLINTGYKNLVSKYDFPPSQRTTSWGVGVHDEYVYDRFLADLQKDQTPFFATLFTLSSHEPYQVPLKHFQGNDQTTLFENAIYYSDSVLGDFIAKLKELALWKNTLVLIVADHGHPLPGPDPNDVPSRFHIPLILTGGALKMKGVVRTPGSQTDIATTLLRQLRIPDNAYQWGRNLLDSTGGFAFYNFNNGFGWITPDGFATVDNIGGHIINQSQGFDTSVLKYGKAYMQVSYQDYLER